MITSHFLLAAGWIIYCAVHSMLANTAAKGFIMRVVNVSKRSYRLLYNVIAFAGLFILISMQLSIKSVHLFSPGKWENNIAVVITGAGLVIMLICIAKYFPQMNGVSASPKEGLEISGIHRYVRHPLYLGTFLFLAGLLLFFPSIANLIAVVIIVVYTLIGVRFEEKKLIKRFGTAYKQYQTDTSMILPFFAGKTERRK